MLSGLRLCTSAPSIPGLSEYLTHHPQAAEEISGALSSGSRERVEAAVAAYAADESAVERPSGASLRWLAFTVAVPAVGFGFVDNFIMIIAGDAIDHSIGITLGISTMAAAGLGNLVSDLGGLGLQGVMEQKLSMTPPAITTRQRGLAVVKVAEKTGQGVGISIGCLIGMFPLLFLNPAKKKAPLPKPVGGATAAESVLAPHFRLVAARHEFVGARSLAMYARDADGNWFSLAEDGTVAVAGATASDKHGQRVGLPPKATALLEDVTQSDGATVTVPAGTDSQDGDSSLLTAFDDAGVLVPIVDNAGAVVGALHLAGPTDASGTFSSFNLSCAIHVASVVAETLTDWALNTAGKAECEDAVPSPSELDRALLVAEATAVRVTQVLGKVTS